MKAPYDLPPDQRERATYGLRLDRLLVVAGLVVLLCLISGLTTLSQVGTEVEVSYGFTVGGTFTPFSSSGLSPAVGQLVTVVWRLTADTGSSVTFAESLTRGLKSPGSSFWDLLSDFVTAGEASDSGGNWVEWSYDFTPQAPGTYTAQGSYPDCGSCTPELSASSGSGTVSVEKAATTTAVSVSPGTSATGEAVTVTATVTPSLTPPVGTFPPPTGAVDFYANSEWIGSGFLDEGTPDKATLDYAFSAEDSPVTIEAAYAGDAGYEGSSGDTDLVVSRADATVQISTVTPAISVVGETYTVSGMVSPIFPAGATPTGNVTVTDEEATSAAGAVGVDGSWSCSLASKSVGTKTITASYEGDDNYNPDETLAGDPLGQQPVDHEVKLVSTTTVVSSSADPSVTGETVTFTATVAAVSPGVGIPTGAVTFYKGAIGGAPIGTDTLDVSGQATASDTFDASESSVSIYAQYEGDSSYDTSDSTAFVQTINKAITEVAFTSDAPDPSVVGEAYDVSGTVAVASPGSLPLTGGTVTVDDGAGPVTATLTLGDGTWTCSLVSTTAGPKTLTAIYSGDTNYATSSRTEVHAVGKASTTLLITSDTPEPSVIGEAYIVSGTVAVDSPGSPPLTGGTVTVDDGAGPITATLTLGDGKWTCSLVSTTAGMKALTATYSGDDNYAGSDDTESHTVSKTGTTLAITSDAPDASVYGESYTIIGIVTPTDTAGPLTTNGTVAVSDGTNTCMDLDLSWDSINGRWDWSCSLPSTAVGSNTLTATYSGDDNYVGASDDEPHTVNKASTTVAIASDTLDPSAVGQPYTVSGSVAVDSPGSLPLTGGTVTVDDGGDPVTATLTLDDGTWTCSLVSTTAGAKTLTATYSGDDNYAGASDDEPHQADKAGTTVLITTDAPDASVVGQPYTVSGTVTPENTAGTHDTDGTVTVSDGTPANDVTVTSLTWIGDRWSWSCSFTSTTAGAKTLTASYSGDDNYDGPSDDDESHTVNKASTTVAIASDDLDPSVVGESYTVSGTVTPAYAAGTHATSGTVTVSDGTVSSTDTTLVWNAGGYWDWSCSLTSTTVGTKTLAATYSGDDNYAGAIDDELHTVTQGTASVEITPTTWDSGSSGSFTATLTAATGVGTPSGTVTFQIKDKYGAAIANTGPHVVSGGTATSGTVTLSASQSPVSVTVDYSGDANFEAGLGDATVTVAASEDTFVITGDNPDPSVAGATISVAWAYGGGFPEDGTVEVSMTDGTDTVSRSTDVSEAEESGSCELDTTGIDPGSWDVTATYTGTETTPPPTATDTEAHIVSLRATSSVVSGPSATTACVSQPVLLTATVTDNTSPPDGPGFTGTVTWVTSNGHGTFDQATCYISQGGQCSTYYTPVASDVGVGTVNVTASYSGDTTYLSSASPAFPLKVDKRSTHTAVFGSDTPLIVGDTATFLVTVTDTSSCVPTTPTGDVSVSVVPGGAGTLVGGSHPLIASEGGQFTFTYTPTSATTTPHTFTATYGGDPTHDGSEGLFAQAIEKREADVVVTVTPITAYINQDVKVSVCVEDDTTAGTPGTLAGQTVTLTTDGTGLFNNSGPSLEASLGADGCCTATYTPGAFEAGTTTLTATFGASSAVYAASWATELLAVQLRPTEVTVNGCNDTILVNQGCIYNVTVTDVAGVGTSTSPVGLLTYSSYLGGDATRVPSIGAAPTGSFVYTCTGLNGDAGIDTIYANYMAVDGIHANSGGYFGQGVQRRPTITEVTGSSTAAGVSYTATVKEDPDNAGTDTLLRGNIHLLQPDEIACSGLLGSTLTCNDSFDSGSPLVNVTVKYEPTDRTHLGSNGSVNIERYDQFPDQPGDGTTGANCGDGCGSGGKNVEQMIFDLNAAEVALSAIKLGLDVTALVLDVIPDGVITGGLVVQTGVTIPYSDIAKAIVAGAGIALDIAILAMDTDLDDDGLPDVLEENVTGTDYNHVDTDGDGLGDLDEIDEAGGYYGGSRRPDPNNPDSDGDGLSDGDEAGLYNTSFCVADTDCDTVSDGVEVGTWSLSEIRDHADPLMQDTDGDGLRDDVEIAQGCPYVNDADSDDDGLQDGHEDTNRDGVFDPGTIGGTGTTGNGETNFCDPDTDGDGLLDGEEEGLLGEGLVTAVTPTGSVSTEPALDTDSDDDGLSDGEEIKVTQTDPLNWDTDGDSLSDANELIAVGGTWPTRSFTQVSDPLDPDTDDDGLGDEIEYTGTGLGTSHGLGGHGDEACPFVNDDDSDDDGLQDGTESWNGDATITMLTIGRSDSQSTTSPTTGETDFCNPDTDGDGLTDGEEVALLGGLPVDGTTGFALVTPRGVSAAFGQEGSALALAKTVPALDDDSDNDGLSDYEEVNITGTDPLDQDTDNDTLSDANELIAKGGAWPKREFQQESDPLDPDTDDDDLYDCIEYPGSGLGTSRSASLGTPDIICPYVNDDDSDDDGLQDGTEDANHDGTWGVLGAHAAVGGFSTQAVTNSDGYYETDLCNPDTDGDGLLDGEEVGQIGGEPIAPSRPYRAKPGFVAVTPEAASVVPPVVGSTTVPAGYSHPSPIPGTTGDLIAPYSLVPTSITSVAVTIPALDVDTDNDGLSDYEELNITGTDPLDQDSDNDTLKDADELIATGGVTGARPQRTFDQESDPLDVNTDDDGLFDCQEYAGSGLSRLAGATGGDRDTACPYVNDDDSDNDGLQDGAVVHVNPALTVTSSGAPPLGYDYSYTHYEDFVDLEVSSLAFPGVARATLGEFGGEQRDDTTLDVCDSDSDGDGLNDGEEVAIGTNPNDCDTDDDGRNDWHEVTGGGPIPTDPFDPDTDDDGLLDSAEVFGSNTTNPVSADTDGDGLCDGGAGTPWMTSGDVRVIVNPLCKSCSTPGLDPCGSSTERWGSLSGIGDHPNLRGFGEDQNGNGVWDSGETDPNQYDTDGDAIADGIERLSFSTSRQYMIPTMDLFGRPIYVTYPEANNFKDPCGCLNPLDSDSDDDGLSDGYEDANHDGNFDFLPSDFDIDTSSVETQLPDPEETNPCMADSDGDGLSDWEERFQRQPLAVNPPTAVVPIDNDGDGLVDEDPADGIDNDLDHQIDEDGPENIVELTFNPTNPLDWDTDNDWLSDGYEVHYTCVEIEYTQLDNDTDGYINEDEIDGVDNDEDGLIDEDPVDFWVRSIPMLDPTMRDSDSDGYIDGLDEDPCNSELIPMVEIPVMEPVDSDGDGFSDDDEIAAGTHPNGPEDHPIAYCAVDVDFDDSIDDRIWLEPGICCNEAGSVVFDLDSNVLVDLRVTITSKSIARGDFDGDGRVDDIRYTVEYILSNYRAVQLHGVATIDDYDTNLVIDWVVVRKK